MTEATPISAYIICRNEEPVIDRCLQSLKGVVAEIVLVHDGPCDDRTLEIAERHGCRIFVRDAAGYPEAHEPFTIEQTVNDWLLNLDADEFLSDELRAGIAGLVADPQADGWELLWPLWDGRRYFTRRGPYKLVLMRKSKMRYLGVPHALVEIDGRVKRSPLRLDHQPAYNNYSLRVMRTKWPRWARPQAAVYLTDWELIPKYGYPASSHWPAWRAWSNRLAPVLFLPYGVATFVRTLRRDRRVLAPWVNVRLAAHSGLYAATVQFYVGYLRYVVHRRTPRDRP